MIRENVSYSTDPSSTLLELLKNKAYSKLVIVVDTQTRKHCYPRLSDLPGHDLIEVPDGEDHKNLGTCTSIWKQMTDLQLDRHALMVVVGGGVLGDMAGFCAATYKRGIDFALVPTTLLALVDASIGGKLGVDFDNFKNHIGVFRQPVLTILSTLFLDTLSDRELKSGFAEVIKHILISDRKLWDSIRSMSFDTLPWDELIRHSVEFKSRVTTEDPTEKGLRKILNAGHTLGHAAETYFINSGRRILHGEAIAIGLVAEAHIAHKRGKLTAEELTEIVRYIGSLYPHVHIDADQANSIARLTLQDKKNKDGNVLCVLQEGIGAASWDNPISTEEAIEALLYYSAQM